MRVLFALVALAAVAAAHHGGEHKLIPDLFEGQREYVYNFRSLVATGLPRLSQRYAGLEKYGVLKVQVYEQQGNTKVLGLKLDEVMSGSFDKEVEDIENRRIEGISHSTDANLEKYGPVFVKMQDNQVQKLKTPEGMPEEIINIYRAIAGLFTVGKPTEEKDQHAFAAKKQQGEPVVFRRLDKGISGTYETTYEILSDPENYHQLNLTRSLNYMKRVGRDPRFLQNGHDARGCKNVCPSHKPEHIERNMEPEMSNWETPVAEGCPVDFHPKKELVESATTYNYNMTYRTNAVVIEEAQALDNKILPLRQQQIKTVSLLKLRLQKQGPITHPWEQNQAAKQYDDITFRFPEGHKFDLEYLSLYNKAHSGEMLKDQIIPMIKALSEIITADNLEFHGETGNKIVQITMALGALKKSELQSLWTVLGRPEIKGETKPELEKVMRKVLLDTMSISGSNDAAELLLELIKEQKLTTLETVHVLQALQKSLVKPTMKIINLTLSLVTDAKFQEKRTIFSTAGITFAEMVRGHCGKHHEKTQELRKDNRQMMREEEQHEDTPEQRLCHFQDVKTFVEQIRRHLHETREFTQQTVYIQILGRLAHPEAIKTLIPYIYGEQEVIAQVEKMNRRDERENVSEYVQFLRQVAIYSLHHSAKYHGAAIQPIVQGIYFNKHEKYELRIAAFSVLMATQPTEATFGRIVLELPEEKDMEVASYAYSALRSLANTTIPCMRQTARRVQNVLGGLPEKTFGAHHSKWIALTKYMQLANLGVKGQWELTQSNVSAIPRAFFAGFTANKGPFVSTVLDFGMITKGFENLHHLVAKKGGVEKIVENVMQRVRREARQFRGEESVEKMLEQIEETLQFNNDENREEPRAIIHGNVFGNEHYLPVDKEFMTKVAKKAGEHLIKIVRQEGSERNFRFVRILMPRTFVKVTPGVNGLPVVLSNRHPIVVSLSLKDLKTRFGAEKKELKLNPFTVALSGLIQPTVYHTSIHSALFINPLEKTRTAYGVRAVEQTYLTLPIDASIQYTHMTQTVAFTIRPRFEKVFFHKTQAMTFKTEALLIRDVKRSMLDRYTVVKAQQKPFSFERVFGEKLGMALRVKGLSMNQDYAINFLKNRVALEKNVVVAFMKEMANEWFVPRQWTVRVEQSEKKAIDEIKMVVRLNSLLKERLHEKQHQQKRVVRALSQEQLVKEQAYPEHMRMIAYEQEFERITGRKPETQQLEQALERIVKKTENYWTQVDSQLREQLTKENTQVRSIEYVILAKGKKEPMTVTGHAIIASTLSKQAKLAELKVQVEKRPISFEVHAVSAFTLRPQPFHVQLKEEAQRGILGFVAQLETRKTGKQQYSGKVLMTKSEEQKQLKQQPIEHQPWFVRQCREDEKEQKSEISTACEIYRFHQSRLNHLQFEIELPHKVHPRLANATHKAREALKIRLYRNLRANYNADTKENKIEGDLIYSDKAIEVRMANLTIRTPDHEELVFSRIALPKALRPNLMWTLKEQAKAFLRNDRPEPTCVYNGQKLRTFDNVTVSLKAMKEGEKYIIARHNVEDPKFTIVGKKQGQKSEIEVVLRNATLIKLTPPTTEGVYKIRINSTEVEITPKKAEIYQYARHTRNSMVIRVEKHEEGHPTLIIQVRDQRMRIVYDEKNLKIVIAKRSTKGQLTGLCGDMNNQHIEELTGPRGCDFERQEDFVHAFGLTKQQEPIQGKWWCPEGVHPRGASQEQIRKHQEKKELIHKQKEQIFQERRAHHDAQKHMTEETKTTVVDDRVCFSVEPVKACKSGLRPTKTEKETVAFACFKKEDQRAIHLQREVQTHKVASHLPSVRASGLVHKHIEVPAKCE